MRSSRNASVRKGIDRRSAARRTAGERARRNGFATRRRVVSVS